MHAMHSGEGEHLWRIGTHPFQHIVDCVFVQQYSDQFGFRCRAVESVSGISKNVQTPNFTRLEAEADPCFKIRGLGLGGGGKRNFRN